METTVVAEFFGGVLLVLVVEVLRGRSLWCVVLTCCPTVKRLILSMRWPWGIVCVVWGVLLWVEWNCLLWVVLALRGGRFLLAAKKVSIASSVSLAGSDSRWAVMFCDSLVWLMAFTNSCFSLVSARLTNTTQHNGDCGCDFCLHPGQQISKGRGSIRVYPQPYP